MKISRVLFCVICLFVVLFNYSCNKRPGDPRILVFSKTEGFYHESIPKGIAALQKLGTENNIIVDTTTNADWFTDDSLKNYSAVVFLSTTGDVLDHYQEAAFERYIQAGGGFLGIHAAADTEYGWGWYGRLVGAYFMSHPDQQEARLEVVDGSHAATKHLPKEWKRKDEWYDYKDISDDIQVLITIDESSYEGGENPSGHPMAWYHEYDGGRAFYTGLGHTDESYDDPLFLEHLLGGLEYVIGGNKKLDYDDVRTFNVPEEERFTKNQLIEGGVLNEPTEMAILPNLDILIAQRRGQVMLFENETKEVKQIGFLDVYHESGVSGVNAEEGLMGIVADPDFQENGYIYMFYSPADTSVNRLSRFELKNDTVDNATEKTILEFYSQRGICCHTGGSLAFGENNVLYLSTGDNSTPFDQPNETYANHGFAPLDARPGYEQYDARRTAGNTNDLRGKILRIIINDDATYDIPEGNLFGKNQDNTKPEIYVMGDRNPYRISVDTRTNYLYWGEVGPDSPRDSLETRGPRGYDEINQAREAGNFGWPFFVGDNYAYRSYDYTSGESGELFDPKKPINNSPNNTGLTELPPAQPAFIWYPYAESPDFPDVGTGGRNALAGPVYYVDDFPKETRYPAYYNGKLFIYDWVRGWVKAVTMQDNGDFDKMEPFMGSTKFAAPIEMEVGPDGLLYLLEYGKGWFAKNPDAGLVRVDYNSGPLQKETDESMSVDANKPKGEALVTTLDCAACHKENEESVGPSYLRIAEKYKDDSHAVPYLSAKIIDGSTGVWGANAMPAHPAMKEADANAIAEWIMALNESIGHQQ